MPSDREPKVPRMRQGITLMQLRTKRTGGGQARALRARLTRTSPPAILQLAAIAVIETGRWIAFLGELVLHAGHLLTRTGYNLQQSPRREMTRTSR
jgi:hypothetical protein